MLDLSLEAIRKKLIGQKLTYPEACSIMEDIAHDRLNQLVKLVVGHSLGVVELGIMKDAKAGAGVSDADGEKFC